MEPTELKALNPPAEQDRPLNYSKWKSSASDCSIQLYLDSDSDDDYDSMEPTETEALNPSAEQDRPLNNSQWNPPDSECIFQPHPDGRSNHVSNRMGPIERETLHSELDEVLLEIYSFEDVDFDSPGQLKTELEAACCEGRVNAVKRLLTFGVDVNRLSNANKRAPIHFAAEAGHADILQILLNNKQCNPNLIQISSEKQTALLIAVENDSIDCVRVLLDYCANPNIANCKGFTPINIAARKGNRKVVELILKISKFLPNLNDIHDSPDRGKLTTRQILQTKFPDIDLPTAENKFDITEFFRSNFDGNELFFLEKLESIPDYLLTKADVYCLMCSAISYYFLNATRELLRKGRRVDGFLKLGSISKLAVSHGDPRVVREMLTVDANGYELLLHACQQLGNIDDRTDDRLECFRLIMKEPNINVQCEDHHGNTPLRYAASAKSIEAVDCLLKLGGSLVHRNVLGVPPLEHMSFGALSDVFGSCIQEVKAEVNKSGIQFDYSNLIPDEVHGEDPQRGIKKKIFISTTPEMEALTYIAEHPDLQQLLSHPLLSSLLCLKWDEIFPVLCVNFVFYAIFYFLINFHILSTNHKIDSTSSTSSNSSNLTSTILDTDSQQTNTLGAFTAIFLILLAVREAFQLIYSPGHYLSYSNIMFKVILIVLGAWTLVAPNPEIGAVVILLSAWEFVILIGQCPPMSTGIEMLKTVTITFIRFLSLYAIFILTFSFAFSTLFFDRKDNEHFDDLGQSLFKTIVMLTGELDASNIPFKSHPVLGRSIFVLFVFLVPIVMLNLLNGLAASDTAVILKKSEIVALISCVKLINYFDEVAAGSGLIIFTGRWFSESDVRRSILFKPLEFIGMRTRLFPRYLPKRKITVMPYEFNKIIVHGMSRTCPDRKMWCRASIERWVPQRLRPWFVPIWKAIHRRLLSVWEAFCRCLLSIRYTLPAVRCLFGRSADWLMDRLTVDRAREILSHKESRRKSSMSGEKENRKLNAKFDRLEALICRSGRGNIG